VGLRSRQAENRAACYAQIGPAAVGRQLRQVLEPGGGFVQSEAPGEGEGVEGLRVKESREPADYGQLEASWPARNAHKKGLHRSI
nr:hypothetical protein [Tanacetum cinerariifolium]